MKKYGIPWIKMPNSGGKNMLLMIIFGGIGLIIILVLLFSILGLITTMLPYIIGLAVAIGLIYLMGMVAKSGPQQQPTNAVEMCKSMYPDSESINECIKGNL
jgi:hypothetical protein